MAPIIEQFTLQKSREVEKRRVADAKEIRRKSKTTKKVNYRIEKNGDINYKGRLYSLSRFKTEVVEKLRNNHWIAFRALASSETAFGMVVNYRHSLLENRNEFDTYWDNLTKKPEIK